MQCSFLFAFQLFNRIKQLQEINMASSTTNVLNEAESCLFIMSTVARRLANNDPEGSIAYLISNILLPALASAPLSPLEEVCCIFFSQLSRWIICHPDLRRQVIQQVTLIVERAVDVPVDQLAVWLDFFALFTRFPLTFRARISPIVT